MSRTIDVARGGIVARLTSGLGGWMAASPLALAVACQAQRTALGGLPGARLMAGAVLPVPGRAPATPDQDVSDRPPGGS